MSDELVALVDSRTDERTSRGEVIRRCIEAVVGLPQTQVVHAKKPLGVREMLDEDRPIDPLGGRGADFKAQNMARQAKLNKAKG